MGVLRPQVVRVSQFSMAGRSFPELLDLPELPGALKAPRRELFLQNLGVVRAPAVAQREGQRLGFWPIRSLVLRRSLSQPAPPVSMDTLWVSTPRPVALVLSSWAASIVCVAGVIWSGPLRGFLSDSREHKDAESCG